VRGAWVEADDALDLLVEPGKVFADPGHLIATFARIFRRLRRAYSDAGEETEPLPAEVLGLIGSDTYSLAPLCALVELADGSASVEIAERAYDALARAAERGVLFSSGWMFLIPRVLGVAARRKGQCDLAEAHFQTAVEIAIRVGARPELARTYLDHAELLIAQGGTSHRSRTVELLREAATIFLDFGMQPFARRSTRLAQELGVGSPPTPAGRSAHPDDLNDREIDVLVQMTQGRTREEIATDLLLRQQTVTGHLASIFDKTRVSDEATAVSYAREKGLAGPVDRRHRSAVEELDDRATRAPRIILVTGIVAPDALISRSGDTKAQRLFRIHGAVIRECLDAHHGDEVTHTGEGIEASFSSASAAVECAIAIQKAFARRNSRDSIEAMQVRIGINAGEPIAAEGRLFGAAVQIAFVICGRAKPGEILVAEAVAQLLADTGHQLVDRGLFTFKGLSRIGLAEVLWQRSVA
jgi:class 3 adenylate cyclase